MPSLHGRRSRWQCADPSLPLPKLSKCFGISYGFSRLKMEEKCMNPNRRNLVPWSPRKELNTQQKTLKKPRKHELVQSKPFGSSPGEKTGSPTPTTPPPHQTRLHARQVLATWGQWWPARVPSPKRAPEQKADGPQTARRHISFPVFSVLAERPRSRGSGGEGERRVLTCTRFGIRAAGDRRAADPRTDSASSPAQGSLVLTSPSAHHGLRRLHLKKTVLFPRVPSPGEWLRPKKVSNEFLGSGCCCKNKVSIIAKKLFSSLRGKHIPHDFQKGAGLVYKYSTLIAL